MTENVSVISVCLLKRQKNSKLQAFAANCRLFFMTVEFNIWQTEHKMNGHFFFLDYDVAPLTGFDRRFEFFYIHSAGVHMNQ